MEDIYHRGSDLNIFQLARARAYTNTQGIRFIRMGETFGGIKVKVILSKTRREEASMLECMCIALTALLTDLVTQFVLVLNDYTTLQ